MLTYLMDMSDMSIMLPLLLMPAKVAFSRYLALLLLPAPPVIHLLALGPALGAVQVQLLYLKESTKCCEHWNRLHRCLPGTNDG